MMITRLLRTKRNDGNKTKKDKGRNLDGIKKKDEIFQCGKQEKVFPLGHFEFFDTNLRPIGLGTCLKIWKGLKEKPSPIPKTSFTRQYNVMQFPTQSPINIFKI